MKMDSVQQAMQISREMLQRWVSAAEPLWYFPPGAEHLACFGSGYIHWGIQSNLNVAAALATLADQSDEAEANTYRERALATLRFVLETHATGHRRGANGGQWGRSWISVLGLERGMHGLWRLQPYFNDQDHELLRQVLLDEARWLLHEGRRGQHLDVHADPWGQTGKNSPESNIWNGCFLWRISQMFPEDAEANAFAQRAHDYLINGVSIAADATDSSLVAGKPVSERHVGANFFPHYALDHHSYLNVGYMVICVSNAAMLHFDCRTRGFEAPESLHHHQADLWQVLRRMIFPDGRLCRIGGDSRVRFSYCQEYLVPSLLYAYDQLGDAHAPTLLAKLVEKMQQEQQAGDDGTFYAARMKPMELNNPHYYARLESDRADVLAMLLNYAPLLPAEQSPDDSFEASAAGTWEQPEHGAMLDRNPHRIASFAWRAHRRPQAMAQPPDTSDLTDWSSNLCPFVRFLGDGGETVDKVRHCRLLTHSQTMLEGGFVTCGSIQEGVDLTIDEGAQITDVAVSHIAFAALPDGQTCVGLQRVVMVDDRMAFVQELKSLHLNLANDIFNSYNRRLTTAQGEQTLRWPPERDMVMPLESSWAHVEAGLGVTAIYGGDLVVDRSVLRRGGRYRSLAVEQLCMTAANTLKQCRPGDVLIDAGFAVLSDVTSQQTATFEAKPLELPGEQRGVEVVGLDDRRYQIIADFAKSEARVEAM